MQVGSTPPVTLSFPNYLLINDLGIFSRKPESKGRSCNRLSLGGIERGGSTRVPNCSSYTSGTVYPSAVAMI